MSNKVIKNLKIIYTRLKKLGFKKSLPLIYLFFLFLGIIFTFVYAFVPSFVACSSLFGSYFCTPVGLYVVLFFSLPGYILSGNILSFTENLPWGISLLIVITTSFLFYYFLGLAIDKLKNKELNPLNISKIIILIVFSILIFLLLTLL